MERLARNIGKFVDGFANSSVTVDAPVQNKVSTARSSYMLEEDNYLDVILNNAIAKASLRRIADNFYSTSIEDTLKLSTLVSVSSYPALYQILENCCHTLSIDEIPEVYVTGKLWGINALSLEVKLKKFILLSREAVVCLSESELRFLLGHELGHHQQGNLVCHTVNGLLNSLNAKSEIFGPLISDTIEVPLKRWCRQSEFNADRAGLICCGEMKAVESLLSKIIERSGRTLYGSVMELYNDHPFIQTRVNKLEEFRLIINS